MKTIYRSIASFGLASLLMLGFVSTASAQRGGFHGGFRGGFRGGIGFGGPRVGIGIGVGYPALGVRLGVLPVGYYSFYWGPTPYYYYGGVFYQDYNGSYQVVAPPVGAEVPSLPENAHPINIDGQQFYEFNGVYYRQATNPDGKVVYVVAGKDGVLNTSGDNSVDQTNTPPAPPQVGDMTDQLPQNSRKIKLNGKRYWVTPDNIYLEEVKTNNGTSYRVVSVPEPDGQGGKDM